MHRKRFYIFIQLRFRMLYSLNDFLGMFSIFFIPFFSFFNGHMHPFSQLLNCFIFIQINKFC